MEELIIAIIGQALLDYIQHNYKNQARLFLENQTLVDIDFRPIMDALDREEDAVVDAIKRVEKEHPRRDSYYWRKKFWAALNQAKREAAPISYRIIDQMYA